MSRAAALPGYELLAAVHDEALHQAQAGKGAERHAGNGEAFHDQQIVQLGEWMGGSTAFCVGQACKKAIESTRLPTERARAELLGAINYLAAAVIVLDRRERPPAGRDDAVPNPVSIAINAEKWTTSPTGPNVALVDASPRGGES